MKRTTMTVAALAVFAAVGAVSAQPAAPKAAAPAAAAAAGKSLYPQAQFDLMLKERMAQGQPDSPELRSAIREELNTRELLVREAKKANLDKNADIKNQMDLAGQTVLVRAFGLRLDPHAHPIPEGDLRKEYDAIKTQMGDKEYKVQATSWSKRKTKPRTSSPPAAEGGQVRRARQVPLQGSRLQGPRRRPRLECARRLREAVRRRDGGHTQGQVHRPPVQTQFGYHVIFVRGCPRREGAAVRRGQAATATTVAGRAPRQVLQGTAREGWRLVDAASAAIRDREARQRPAPFPCAAPRDARIAGRIGRDAGQKRAQPIPSWLARSRGSGIHVD